MFAAIDRAIVWTTAAIVALLMGAMVVSILAGVFFRYALNDALTWPEEFARFAMIWVTMLGASLVTRYGGHVAVNALVEKLGNNLRRPVIVFGRLLVALFLGLVIVFGYEMTTRTTRQTSPALGVSMSLPNSALPVGSVLMIYQLLVLTARREGRDNKPPHLPMT